MASHNEALCDPGIEVRHRQTTLKFFFLQRESDFDRMLPRARYEAETNCLSLVLTRQSRHPDDGAYDKRSDAA